MSRLAENVKDGAAKSEFNQQPAMMEMLEDRNKTRSGLYSQWNHVSPAYRRGYDAINWEGGKANGE